MNFYFMRRAHKVIAKAAYADITHFIADTKCVTAYTSGGQLLLDESLKEISAEHPELVYTHRSTLVRADDIVSVGESGPRERWISRYRGFLKSGVQVKVSRYKYKAIRDLIAARSVDHE